MHDVVIRGGTIVDGTGAPARTGDVAIDGGRVTSVGGKAGAARREIDAEGLLVTPGWVDIHTHYDGQVTWDPHLTPSGWHGVTTLVMGNCGVGFAPAKPDRHEWLIGLMEGVEDIPGTALAAGIDWQWESFPEYLDAIERMPRALDVGAQVPHGAVRAYVMGERGAKNQKPTADDIEAMAAIVREALRAGALGFSTSRTLLHRAVDGEPVPGTFAGEDELLGIGRALGDVGTGVLELASDLAPEGKELAWMERLSVETGRPVSFALLQSDFDPTQWRRLLDATDAAAARGARLVPQVAGRPTGLLLGLESSFHPFAFHPTYRELAALPLAERVRKLRDPAIRAKVLGEK
ncbi:MAG TPA: amidohydrolase family protein, partial [Myxococcota bacterium]|nr:amidohydrolase family protein [Myxococcota bacterium]